MRVDVGGLWVYVIHDQPLQLMEIHNLLNGITLDLILILLTQPSQHGRLTLHEYILSTTRNLRMSSIDCLDWLDGGIHHSRQWKVSTQWGYNSLKYYTNFYPYSWNHQVLCFKSYYFNVMDVFLKIIIHPNVWKTTSANFFSIQINFLPTISMMIINYLSLYVTLNTLLSSKACFMQTVYSIYMRLLF